MAKRLFLLVKEDGKKLFLAVEQGGGKHIKDIIIIVNPKSKCATRK